MNSNKHKVLILSGGMGRRYGIPKALAKYKGETFLDIIVNKCLSLNLDVYVVLNQQVNNMFIDKRKFTSIIGDSNKDMYNSVLRGIKAIGDFSKLIIWPVDHPFVSANTIQDLLTASNKNKFLVPSYLGKLGHPVMFPSSALEFVQQCHNLKELIKLFGRIILQVNDNGILLNINKKEDIPQNEQLL